MSVKSWCVIVCRGTRGEAANRELLTLEGLLLQSDSAGDVAEYDDERRSRPCRSTRGDVKRSMTVLLAMLADVVVDVVPCSRARALLSRSKSTNTEPWLRWYKPGNRSEQHSDYTTSATLSSRYSLVACIRSSGEGLRIGAAGVGVLTEKNSRLYVLNAGDCVVFQSRCEHQPETNLVDRSILACQFDTWK